MLSTWGTSTGSGALPVAALRGTGIQASSAASYTVSWPAGTVAGDTAVIFVAGGFAASATPSGWTRIDNSVGANWNGQTYTRVLNAADITAGNVVVSMAGTFDSVVAIATMQGPTMGGYAVPVAVAAYNSSGVAASRTVTYTSHNLTDYELYFGSYRANGAVTCALGTQRRTISDGGSATGALYTDNPASVGSIGVQFNFSPSTANGDYSVVCSFVGT